MELTLESLEKLDPCSDGLAWWKAAKYDTVEATITQLLAEDRIDWANWLIAHVLTHDNQIRYAIFAARQVLDIYEKQYPGDNRPRRAVEAAETCLKDKTAENRAAARAAAESAWSAWAAEAAGAAWAAGAARLAGAAVRAAAWAARAAGADMKKKLIEYGVSLLSN